MLVSSDFMEDYLFQYFVDIHETYEQFPLSGYFTMTASLMEARIADLYLFWTNKL